MWKAILREFWILDDFLKFYFWLVGVPYLLQWMTVTVMS